MRLRGLVAKGRGDESNTFSAPTAASSLGYSYTGYIAVGYCSCATCTSATATVTTTTTVTTTKSTATTTCDHAIATTPSTLPLVVCRFGITQSVD